ncbi:MAG: helix-turn-helix domain-containing protein [Lacibacter sp.]
MKNKVKDERLKQMMNQTEFAEMLNVSRQTIHAIETGKYIPTTLLALKIAKLLNKEVEELFILEKND